MKKLIPALCMLLVAATLLGTSTYAWFSMNTEVNATGMKVKAVTNANLYIQEGLVDDVNTITGVTANMNTSTHSLMPANLVDASGTVTVRVPNGDAGFSTKPTVSTAGVVKEDGWATIGTFTATTDTATLAAADTLGKYIAGETMTIVRKADTTGTYDVDAVVTVSLGGTSNLNKAIYCGFLVGDTFTAKAADAVNSTGNITFTFDNLLSAATDNAAQKITFVLWYEGNDDNCTSNNAIAVTENTVSIVFTSSDHT